MRLEHRNLLIDIIPKLLNNRLDFENLVRAVGQAAVLTRVPGGASYDQATNFIVVAASEEGWVAVLNDRLAAQFPNRNEFADIKKALAEIVVPTTADPFREVLLDGDMPFVNRGSLRTALLRLVDTSGDRVLIVDGKEKTGKSFSYYLLNHVATRNGFRAHLFDMSASPSPLQLAEEIMQKIPVAVTLSEQGSESAERWARKLAGDVQRELLQSNVPRFFVFDNVPATAVTAEDPTLHLISRLATLAHQDLRPLLRVVLVRFPSDKLESAIEDVVSEDQAQPFTPTDMVQGLMQIANARKWGITEAAAKQKIDEFEAIKAQTLRDRFRFLRKLVRELSDAAKAAGPQP